MLKVAAVGSNVHSTVMPSCEALPVFPEIFIPAALAFCERQSNWAGVTLLKTWVAQELMVLLQD